MFAKGGEDGPEYNRAHRLVNAWEFAKLTRQAAEMGRYVVAVRPVSRFLVCSYLLFPKLGDFNSIPSTLPMTIIREHAGLSDSWQVTHPNETPGSSASSPRDAIAKFGVTADSPLNSYSANKPLDPHARRFLGKRLDYILYRQPHKSGSTAGDGTPVLKVIDCKVVFTDKVPDFDFSFSDHFGLEALLEIQLPHDMPSSAGRAIDSAQVSSELSNTSIATAIQALAACYQFSRHRSRKELRIFGISLLLLLAIVVGASWLPFNWISPIFFLITIFLSWLATTMLYEGFLYGKWERNALMNVIEEMEIHGKALEARHRTSDDFSS